MSKINAVRFINVNYNHNAICISDECFHMNGKSTLLSLQNGGGKSVLVQMLTAPFVHKKYRNTKDRPFESYFTSNKPSFILVEWVLEQRAGYVLTGMMVRKSQEETENDENLEIVNFISEYKEPCIQDIYHLPVVEKGKREMTLKGFAACRQLFDSYKRDAKMKFFAYDMENPAQSRQYFDKLKEYQIYYKEWESIIKKVNLKESGLSELFADCKDEKGLLETWFLGTIENKLNKERDRMKEFQRILEKYAGQYKDNRTKILRRDTINEFREQAVQLAEQAKGCVTVGEELKRQENKLAAFIGALNRCHEEAEQELIKLSGQTEVLEAELSHLEYERLSDEFYKLTETLRYHSGNRDMLEMERENLERDRGQIQKELYLLFCAKQQENVNEWEAELLKVKQKLSVCKKKEEDLEPERKVLGGRLKYYYGSKSREAKENAEEKQQEIKALMEEMNSLQAELLKLEEAILEQIAREGELKSCLISFGQQEGSFNARYQEKLSRNILGAYEPGTLEICQSVYEKELAGQTRRVTEGRKRKEELKQQEKALERALEDKKEACVRSQAELAAQRKQKQSYDEELEKRQIILKYLNLSEDRLFEREQIVEELEKKLSEISELKKGLEREENELEKEYQRLLSGKMTELPKELEDKLRELGVNIVYGMEWLKKNGLEEAKNRELVRKNPFLPYALILSEREIRLVSEFAEKVYTAFPIPIIQREQLALEGAEPDGAIMELSGVNFYIWFNADLLSEEKLSEIIKEKQEGLTKKREAVKIRTNEYRKYFEQKELVKNQSADRQSYEDVQEKLVNLEKQISDLETELSEKRKTLQETKVAIEKTEAAVWEAEKQADYQKRRLLDFAQLREAYAQYEENQKKLEKCRREKSRFQDNQKMTKEILEQKKEQQKTLEITADSLERAGESFEKAYQHYEEYEETKPEAVSSGGEELTKAKTEAEWAAEWEARYEAITSAMSQEVQELSRQAKVLGEKYKASLDELAYLSKKYEVKEKAWLSVSYNRKEEMHKESMLEDCRRKIEKKTLLWNEENTKTAVVHNDREKCRQQIQTVCGEKEPLEKDKIQRQDFEAGRKQLEFQKDELLKQKKELEKRQQAYSENLTALAEFSELPLEEEEALEQKPEEMSSRELRDFKGILVRDYNAGVQSVQKARDELVALIQKILRMEQFGEDFYRKPLEAMLEVSADANLVLSQLDTTLKAYEGLMEKLRVDIALIEKEKEKLVELLEDYIREVHENLGKMDANATILIREKPVKMLKIETPDWEENKALYALRLNDFVEEATLKGTELFERNENAQEYFGRKITTRNLYDTVIGIGNIKIRLYKIEAQREYPITWAEVARNSGGEGFLSAFVVLSSLLHYMRRDDADIFADKNEGKVLLMDNPFAQTNASHLLKPLMDIAKKSNTQLICLTGLGGESIYNRFDNIYVMNLVAASLKNSTQYLRPEHLKGEEPQTLELSQIEVTEQMEMLF